MSWLTKIGSKLLGMSSWKLMLLVAGVTSVTVGSTAFIAGLKWERADRYKEAKSYITEIELQAIASMNTINSRWEAEAVRARIEVENWNIQATIDQALFNKLLSGQAEIRNKFDGIQKEIIVTNDFGTCKLSNDAIRLLRQATSTKVTGMPNN